MDTVADPNDRECERTERENNMRQNTSNNNVSSPRVQDEENQVANMSHVSDNFTQRVQHRRAGEAALPRPTGQYHNPDQMVTDRLAGLGSRPPLVGMADKVCMVVLIAAVANSVPPISPNITTIMRIINIMSPNYVGVLQQDQQGASAPVGTVQVATVPPEYTFPGPTSTV